MFRSPSTEQSHKFLSTLFSTAGKRWSQRFQLEMFKWIDEDRLCDALSFVLNVNGKNYEMKNDNVVPVAYIAAFDPLSLWNKWFAFIVTQRKKKHTNLVYRQSFSFFVVSFFNIFLCICYALDSSNECCSA